MPTCRPLVRWLAASSAVLRNATMSKKSVSSRLNGRSTAIEKFATAMPDWLYRRSGWRVSLPTKATRFTVPLLQIPVGQLVVDGLASHTEHSCGLCRGFGLKKRSEQRRVGKDIGSERSKESNEQRI